MRRPTFVHFPFHKTTVLVLRRYRPAHDSPPVSAGHQDIASHCEHDAPEHQHAAERMTRRGGERRVKNTMKGRGKKYIATRTKLQHAACLESCASEVLLASE